MEVSEIRDEKERLISERQRLIDRLIAAKAEYQKTERMIHAIDIQLQTMQS
jgi:hypothetical protein